MKTSARLEDMVANVHVPTHLSSSLIFLSLSFFSFSISRRMSSRRSTSAWAFPESSLWRATSCSRFLMRSASSVLAWASRVAFWAWQKTSSQLESSCIHFHVPRLVLNEGKWLCNIMLVLKDLTLLSWFSSLRHSSFFCSKIISILLSLESFFSPEEARDDACSFRSNRDVCTYTQRQKYRWTCSCLSN